MSFTDAGSKQSTIHCGNNVSKNELRHLSCKIRVNNKQRKFEKLTDR